MFEIKELKPSNSLKELTKNITEKFRIHHNTTLVTQQQLQV